MNLFLLWSVLSPAGLSLALWYTFHRNVFFFPSMVYL